MTKLLSTKEAAELLKITPRRVLVLIKEGRLPAIKVANVWTVYEEDLKLVAIRKHGRPPSPKPKNPLKSP